MSLETQLGSKEKGMHRALMNDKDPQAMRKWNYNRTQFLIGRKTTNGMNGEIKIVFEKVPRLKEEPIKTNKEIVLEQILNSKTEIKAEIIKNEGYIQEKATSIEQLTEYVEQAKLKNMGLRIALEIIKKNSQ